MANIGSPPLASEMNVFYNRLNTIRKNHALATLTNKEIKSNTPTKSSQMTTLKSDLETTATMSKYITDRTFDLKEIGIDKPTKYQSYSAVSSALEYMESVCVHDGSDYSHRSNNSDDSDRGSNWAGDVNKGDIDRSHGVIG